jgi:hypothetical protein
VLDVPKCGSHLVTVSDVVRVGLSGGRKPNSAVLGVSGGAVSG